MMAYVRIKSPPYWKIKIKIFEIIKNAWGPKDMIILEKKAVIKAAAKQGINIEINQ